MEEGVIIKEIEKIIPSMMKVAQHIWIDYDKEADVVYISFERPQNADDSVMEGNIIVHKRKEKVVGLTILNASEINP